MPEHGGILRAFLPRCVLVLVLSSTLIACSPPAGPAVAPTAAPPTVEPPAPPATAESVAPSPTPGATTIAGGLLTKPEQQAGSAGEASADAGRYAPLRQQIDRLLADLNGQWAIGIKDLKRGDTLLIDPGNPYPAASLYKLILFSAAYRRIEQGTLSLDQTTRMIEEDYAGSLKWDEELKVGDRVPVKGLLRVIIIQSSNAAAHALERVMGISGPATVNAEATRLGLSQTRLPTVEERRQFSDWRADSPSTSVADLVSYYETLYRGQLISQQASEAMLDLLKEQQINDRIPALLPPAVEVAHKTGNLPGVVNDAGIIFGPQTDVVLVVLNVGADHDEGTEAIATLGELVYRFHN